MDGVEVSTLSRQSQLKLMHCESNDTCLWCSGERRFVNSHIGSTGGLCWFEVLALGHSCCISNSASSQAAANTERLQFN